MRTFITIIACSLAATTAFAQPTPDAPPPPASTEPAAPPTTAEPAAPPAPPTPEPASEPGPVPAPPAPTPPPPPPPSVVKKPSKPRCAVDSSSYYNCERGFGIFHNSRFVAGALMGDAPVTTMDATGTASTAIESQTMVSLAFEYNFLGLPSSFAPTNFHGIELATMIRAGGKFDFGMSFGTAFTVLNLGHGGPGTLRLGGSFGAGFNLAHGFGYLRGRGALVIVPEKLDVEVSVQWSPPPASTSNYEEQTARVSAWYRLDKRKRRAIEVFVETFSRVDANPMVEKDREIAGGVGGGIGMSFL